MQCSHLPLKANETIHQFPGKSVGDGLILPPSKFDSTPKDPSPHNYKTLSSSPAIFSNFNTRAEGYGKDKLRGAILRADRGKEVLAHVVLVVERSR